MSWIELSFRCSLVALLALTGLLFRLHTRRIDRLELDRQGIFRVLGNLVSGQQHHAVIELRELQRASQGFCTSHRMDGPPCTLRLGHDGMHSYNGEPFWEPPEDCGDPAPLGDSRCIRGKGHAGDHCASPSEGWAQKGSPRS